MTACMWIGQIMCLKIQNVESPLDWWMLFVLTSSSVLNALGTINFGTYYTSYLR